MRGGIAADRSRGRNADAASVVSPPLATLWLWPEVLALLVLLVLALETRGEGRIVARPLEACHTKRGEAPSPADGSPRWSGPKERRALRRASSVLGEGASPSETAVGVPLLLLSLSLSPAPLSPMAAAPTAMLRRTFSAA